MLCSYPYKQIALKDWDGDKLKWSHPCCNMSRPEWEDPMGMQDIDKLTPLKYLNQNNLSCCEMILIIIARMIFVKLVGIWKKGILNLFIFIMMI